MTGFFVVGLLFSESELSSRFLLIYVVFGRAYLENFPAVIFPR